MPISFHKERLPNGLTILAEPDPAAHTAAVGFFVSTGARDERPELMGVSHFLEHMMFKGTARRSAEDVNREFDDIGADYNAFTGHESTVYYAHVLPEFLPRAVDLLADMLRPALREEDFSVEKKVILEEIGMYEDRPQWRLQDFLLERYFGKHPLGFRVLGTAQSVGDLGVASMRGYFQQRYSADNIIVALAGKLDLDSLHRDLARLTAGWSAAEPRRRYDVPSPGAAQHALTDARLTRHYLAVMSPGPSAQDPRRYAAAVLSDVLGAGEGSRLHWALTDPGLADEADFSHLPQDRVGSFMAYASCDPDRAAQVEKVLLDTLDAYAAGIDPAEIERAQNKLATQATLKGELPLGRMMNLGGQWTYLQEYVPLEQELERLMAVTPGQVRALLTEMPLAPRTIVRLGPR
jgi:predicted Zn-dependent peptidase